jgi:hypothetical protein
MQLSLFAREAEAVCVRRGGDETLMKRQGHLSALGVMSCLILSRRKSWKGKSGEEEACRIKRVFITLLGFDISSFRRCFSSLAAARRDAADVLNESFSGVAMFEWWWLRHSSSSRLGRLCVRMWSSRRQSPKLGKCFGIDLSKHVGEPLLKRVLLVQGRGLANTLATTHLPLSLLSACHYANLRETDLTTPVKGPTKKARPTRADRKLPGWPRARV